MRPISGGTVTQDRSEQITGNRFVVAFSFPGTYRSLVESIAKELADTYTKERVLYDRFHEEEFAQPNLDTILPNLYLRDSDLVVVIICQEYVNREWTGLEWRKIREHIMANHGHRIMLIRTDDVTIDSIPGLTRGDGFLDVGDRTSKDLVALIEKRIARIADKQAEQNNAPESRSRAF